MSNTTHGGYRITPSNNMLAYDKLPAELREVHRNCIFDFAVPPPSDCPSERRDGKQPCR